MNAITNGNEVEVSHLMQFWLLLIYLSVSWVGMAVVVSLGDAICFQLLGM